MSGNKRKHESRNPVQRALMANFTRAMLRMIAKVQPRSILDVGCGEGYMLGAIAEAMPSIALHGVDLAPAAIADARQRLGDRARLEVGDARELADLGERFDLVVMLEVLEHLDDPAAILPTLATLTQRENQGPGHVLLSVPREPFFRGLNLLRGKNIRALGNDPEHVQHWGRRSFLRFISPSFEPIATPQVFPWVMVLGRPRTLDSV